MKKISSFETVSSKQNWFAFTFSLVIHIVIENYEIQSANSSNGKVSETTNSSLSMSSVFNPIPDEKIVIEKFEEIFGFDINTFDFLL